jgi:hypothetical protein
VSRHRSERRLTRAGARSGPSRLEPRRAPRPPRRLPACGR